MRIVSISDTHLKHKKVDMPPGDVLVLAGDWLEDDEERLSGVNRWLGNQPYKHKVVIAGNHDFPLERQPELAKQLTNCNYLIDQSVTVDGVKFYGSPWQPWFYDWAFNLDKAGLKRVWAKIPIDTDVLVTHGPPKAILDMTSRGAYAGCDELVTRLKDVRPKVHIFGHIHEGYGYLEQNGTLYVNASTCDLHYRPINKPIVIDYDTGTGKTEVINGH